MLRGGASDRLLEKRHHLFREQLHGFLNFRRSHACMPESDRDMSNPSQFSIPKGLEMGLDFCSVAHEGTKRWRNFAAAQHVSRDLGRPRRYGAIKLFSENIKVHEVM